MRYEVVKVTRDTNTVHSRAVPPWEIPLLEHLFDEGNVVRTGEFVTPTPGKLINQGGYPSAKQELGRLIDAYKSDPKSGIPYAILTYGNGGAGERALQKLIDDARSEDEAAAGPARKRKTRTAESLLN